MTEEYRIMYSFVIVPIIKHHSGDQVKENEMGRECGTQGIQGVGGDSGRKRQRLT